MVLLTDDKCLQIKMYKNSLKSILFPLVLGIGIAGGVLFGDYTARHRMKANIGRIASALERHDKLSYTLSLINLQYVDSLSTDSLIERTLPLLIEGLDPHSVYVPAAEMQEMNEPLEGEFDGIGVVFNMATDTIVVLNVVNGGPSDKAGIRAGDRIMYIDDSLVAGQKISQTKIVKRLRGPRGTKVKLSLKRQGITEPVEVTVVRDAIPLKSIDAAMMLTGDTGYARLSAFARTSHLELQLALDTLVKQGMKHFILDLRGNSGGFLDQAITIANEFLPEGRLIVYTEDRARKRMSEYSDGKGRFTDLDMAVLIDEESASSSEILAGALQDNDRAVIVGRRSFGKGLVQRQIPYPDGSALRLTVARYYTPSGRSIQKPYTVGESDEYSRDILERYRHNEFFSADSIHFADSLRHSTVAGRTVYGGGGVMPDIFVPMDTTRMSRWFIEVSGRNILYRYTLEYTDRHREALNDIRTVPQLRTFLDSDTGMLNDFVAYAERHGVKPNWPQIETSRDIVMAQLRAYIGRNSQLQDAGFYSMIYPIDPVLKQAVAAVRNTKRYLEVQN